MKVLGYVVLLTTLLKVAHAELIQLLDEDMYHSVGFKGPMPRFRKALYTAAINSEDYVVDLQDEALVLENCNSSEMHFEFSLDSSKYFLITNPIPASPYLDNCTVLMSNIYKKGNILQDYSSVDVVSLRAIQDNFILAETFIAIFNTTRYPDVYTLSFRYNGREFIGFDYHYFRNFVWILTLTGFMIVVLEIWEVVEKWRSQKYSRLEETV